MGFELKTDFQKTFGNAPKAGAAAQGKEDRPKAQFWLNVGYESEVVLEGEDKPRFISLPMGIPLDSMEPAKTNGQNQVWLKQQHARNDLYDQIMTKAQELAPGETIVFNLQVEVRHIAEDAAPIDPSVNEFVRKLF